MIPSISWNCISPDLFPGDEADLQTGIVDDLSGIQVYKLLRTGLPGHEYRIEQATIARVSG